MLEAGFLIGEPWGKMFSGRFEGDLRCERGGCAAGDGGFQLLVLLLQKRSRRNRFGEKRLVKLMQLISNRIPPEESRHLLQTPALTTARRSQSSPMEGRKEKHVLL
ncbi:hypothetical protein LINPERHAP2_LOCUS21227 [Linum perenne]